MFHPSLIIVIGPKYGMTAVVAVLCVQLCYILFSGWKEHTFASDLFDYNPSSDGMQGSRYALPPYPRR